MNDGVGDMEVTQNQQYKLPENAMPGHNRHTAVIFGHI